MAHICFYCNTSFKLAPGQIIGRRETCSSCDADLHCCKNCSFFDEGSYNECREPQAERVVEKDRSNFCDYFSFRDGDAGDASSSQASKKGDALKKLDDLFK
jgi:hypothetical protein